MKRLLLLLCVLFTSTTIFAQTVFTEDFEGGTSIPAGWTNNDIQGGGDVWSFENTGEASLAADGNQLIYDFGCAGIYAAFDSDAIGDNGVPENAALESPVFDSSALTSVTLSFNHAFAGNFGGSGFVEVKNGDDPSNDWVNVATYTEDNYQGGAIEIDVTNELAGVTNAQVRFRWTGDWSVAWYFDNVEVFQCTETVPGSVSNPFPADNAVDVTLKQDTDFNNDGVINADDAAITFTWDDQPGDVVTGYTFKLGTSNPPDQEFSANDNDGFTIFGLLTDTQYFWSVSANNCAGSSNEVIYSFTTSSTLSAEDFEDAVSFEFFINNGSLNLNANQNFEQINVFDLSGKQVLNKDLSSNDENISIQSLANGLYLAKVQIGNQTKTFKFIK